MDSEALNQDFVIAKAQTFALFNEAVKSNEEAVERNILLVTNALATNRRYKMEVVQL